MIRRLGTRQVMATFTRHSIVLVNWIVLSREARSTCLSPIAIILVPCQSEQTYSNIHCRLITSCIKNSVDSRILQHVVDTRADFVMEVTGKTKGDTEACIKSISFLFHVSDIVRCQSGTLIGMCMRPSSRRCFMTDYLFTRLRWNDPSSRDWPGSASSCQRFHVR